MEFVDFFLYNTDKDSERILFFVQYSIYGKAKQAVDRGWDVQMLFRDCVVSEILTY